MAAMRAKLTKAARRRQGLKTRALLAENVFSRYIAAMKWLTKQEQLVLCVVIGLLLTGLLVKYYRTAHPALTVSRPAKP